MDWVGPNVIHPVVVAKPVESKAEVHVPSTEGMPPLSDITKHKGKRRNRTGSLNAHFTAPESRDVTLHRDNSTMRMPPLTRIRRVPITGGSWDDNSVGHGSVAARMRRERNRAILRTQSTTTNPLYHAVDTHANVTSTLNLINTTSLSPLPSERFHDNSEWLQYWCDSNPHHSVATKSSAGSMCNIPVTGYPSHSSNQQWDTLSIPEFHSTNSCDRTCKHRSSHRHSYSSGYANTSYLHSSPTSGCASIASSDLDSADFMYFNINDDSSYFDGDSLFADSLGIIGDADENNFSTNILSLLEEGSISCRTPFPASDWPDSISELDFDCSEGKSDDVTNCDALSDIGPSCSSPPRQRRMATRRNMSQNKTSEAEQTDDTEDSDDQPSISEVQPTVSEMTEKEVNISVEPSETLTPTESVSSLVDAASINFDGTISETSWLNLTHDQKNEFLKKLTFRISQTLSSEEQFDVMQLLAPNVVSGTPSNGHISASNVDYARLSKVTKYLEQRRRCVDDCDWMIVKSPERKNGILKLIKQKRVARYDDGPSCSFVVKNPVTMEICDLAINRHNTTKSKVVGMAMTQDDSAKYTRSRYYDSTNIFNDSVKFVKPRYPDSKILSDDSAKLGKSRYYDPTKLSDDSAKLSQYRYYDSTKTNDDSAKCNKAKIQPQKYTNVDLFGIKSRARPGSRQETSSTKSADPQHLNSCSDPQCQGCSSNLRRSNSEGNIPKSVGAETQKEHRRQQRQARRWAKWLKTRHRKENRQLIKEHRSGLFLNEKKVKLKVDCEEIDVDIS